MAPKSCFVCAGASISGLLIPALFRTGDDWTEEAICALCLVGAAVEEAEEMQESKVRLKERGRLALRF